MGKKDPRVDTYIAKSADFAKPLLTYIRKTVHAGCPEVEETMKWGFPHFMHAGVLCSMAAFKEHAAFGFWKRDLESLGGKNPGNAKVTSKTAKGSAKAAEKPPTYTEGGRDDSGMGQFGKLTAISDLPKEKVLIGYVKKAAELNRTGVKAATRAKPKDTTPLEVPAYFLAAVKKNKAAFKTYQAFSPSKQKEYVEWVTEAKTEETRMLRLETAVQWMSEGKVRNWKYVK